MDTLDLAANNAEYAIPADGYLAFDAITLKRLIIDRLNKTSLFTDQNFEGSNLSSIIDLVGFSYNLLMYYLNQTGSEAIFTETQLYENMNRIVKLLNYNPIGIQTSNLSFLMSSNLLPVGNYTIPQFSFITINGIVYSFGKDISFTKTLAAGTTEDFVTASNQNLLYQGQFKEYPLQTALGEEFETVFLLPGDNIKIDHNNLVVFVKSINTTKWSKWNVTSSLFLEKSTSASYEVRLNENKHYEFKFGNNINGKALSTGDLVAIYYLQSDGDPGRISATQLNGGTLSLFTTPQFLQIFANIKDSDLNYISSDNANSLSFVNSLDSSPYFTGETVSDIRTRSPQTFTSQFRLLTQADFKNHVIENFNNIISSVSVYNNAQFISRHVNYLTNGLQLGSAYNDASVLYNQVLFADSNNFNNVYIYCVPNIAQTVSTINQTNFLTPAQKTAILNSLVDKKVLTSEPVLMDPVYMGVGIGLLNSSAENAISVIEQSKLNIYISSSAAVNANTIRNKAATILQSIFATSQLGGTIDAQGLSTQLQSLPGVKRIETARGSLLAGTLSLIYFNPFYENINVLSTIAKVNLDDFQAPFLYDYFNIVNKINVIVEVGNITTEY